MNRLLDILSPAPAPPGATFREGSVVGTSPLRILLDGDTTPVAATPRTLVTVKTGDRVLTMLHHGSRTILGRFKGDHRPPVWAEATLTRATSSAGTLVHLAASITGQTGGFATNSNELLVPESGRYAAHARITTSERPTDPTLRHFIEVYMHGINVGRGPGLIEDHMHATGTNYVPTGGVIRAMWMPATSSSVTDGRLTVWKIGD